MFPLQRRVGMLILITLLITPVLLYAQEDTTITSVGSGIASPALQALVEASGSEAAISFEVTGTNSGFATLCAGEADVTTATRAINSSENNACGEAGVSYIELLLGYNQIALVTSADANVPQCVTTAEVSRIFSPSAEGQVTNWTQVNSAYADSPLAVVVLPESSPVSAALDNLVDGDGLRRDATTSASADEVLAAVAGTPGTLGVLPAPVALEAGDAVRVLQLNAGIAGCAAPTAENASSGLYGAAEPLYVYVNAASLDKQGLRDALNYAFGSEAGAGLAELGFVSPAADDAALNLEHLLDGITGRTFSAEDVSYTIPPTVFGTVTVAGTPLGGDYITALTSALSAQYPSITATTSLRGQPNGIEALCSNLADVAVVHREPTAEDLAACTDAGIETETVALGSLPLVLVANGQSDYLQCLTTDEIIAAWGAGEPAAATWNQVNASFPETAMTLLAPSAGTLANDGLLLVTGSSLPLRADAFTYADAAYRAAATANVEGGLTFMTWAEYLTVLENNQPNITLVSVDAGSGCVEPSAAAIRDGSYPLAQPLSLVVNRASAARAEVQALLWYLASDANYTLIEDAGLVGLLFGDLPELRVRLQDWFTEAQAAAQAAVEAAAEATAEATAEAGS